jgi:hypothetical protein
MPGLVPGIHVLGRPEQGVDGRDKPGHDAVDAAAPHGSDLRRDYCRRRGGVPALYPATNVNSAIAR